MLSCYKHNTLPAVTVDVWPFWNTILIHVVPPPRLEGEIAFDWMVNLLYSDCIFTFFSSRIDQEMHGKGEMGGTEWSWRRNERWRKRESVFLCVCVRAFLSWVKKKKLCLPNLYCLLHGGTFILYCISVPNMSWNLNAVL